MERRYIAYRILAGFACQAPVYALYALERGLDFRGLMTAAVAFGLGRMCCEVPAAAFAEWSGRRTAILLRVALEGLSVLLLFGSHFFVSAFLCGSAAALSWAAERTLLYDWHGPRFAAVFGRATAWGTLSAAAAAAAGGLIALSTFDAVFALRLAVLAGAGAVAWTFRDPPPALVHRPAPRKERPAASFVRTLAFAGLLGAVLVAAAQLQQPLLLASGVTLAAFGPVFAGFQAATALGARLAHRIRSPLAVLAGGSAAALLLLALPLGPAVIAPLALLKFLFGVSQPVIARSLNERAPADRRTAWLSMRSVFETAVLAAVAPLIGLAADRLGVPAAFGLAALLTAPCLFLSEEPCAVSSPSRSPV